MTGGPYYIETSSLTWFSNKWTAFYMTGTSVITELGWSIREDIQEIFEAAKVISAITNMKLLKIIFHMV